MMLRSSSTPVLGSLLSSVADSPNNSYNIHHEVHCTIRHLPTTPFPCKNNRLSFYPSLGSLHLNTISCSSSPMSPPVADFSQFDRKGFHRVQSEGNLQGLALASCKSNEEFHDANKLPKKLSGKQKCFMLQTIPSFSFHNSRARCGEEDDESDILEDGSEWLNKNEQPLMETNRSTEKVMALSGSKDFSLYNKESMDLSEEARIMGKIWNVGSEEEKRLANQETFLARGFDIDGGNGGGDGGRGGNFKPVDLGGDGGDDLGVEEYYKRMVEENPGNSLFLGNYAQFLYESKRDLHRAEEYYSRAILADPNDGEILSQYANLVWELHGDQERSSTYFERAVQASPQDSHVHAAYASFIWETEEEDDECNAPSDVNPIPQQFLEGAMASV